MRLQALVVVAFALCCANAAAQEVLLIPESTGDSIGIHSPVDGVYLGDLFVDDPAAPVLTTPIEVIVGPDGMLWLSDQSGDGMYRFTTDGIYLDKPISGADNVRGADTDGVNLFLSSITGVYEFTPAGVLVTQHAADTFDVLRLADGRFLVSNNATPDSIQLWEPDWTLPLALFERAFPEQVAPMQSNDNYLVANFTSNSLVEYQIDGAIVQEIVSPGGLGGLRGIGELDNGNWIFTNGTGVHVLELTTGLVTTVRPGVSARFVSRIDLGAGPVGGPEFIRGDANADGGFDISDAVFTLASLFVPGAPAPSCRDAADANDDETLDISDAVYALAALFVPGAPLPGVPHPGCGEDPAGIGLDCATYGPCP